MNSIRDFLTNMVENVAAECGITVYQAADWANCGWWIFKDDAGTTKAKLYYDFDADYCWVREGKGNLYSGVRCEYGKDADEKKLVDYIKGKLPKSVSIDDRLADAAARSALTDADHKNKSYLKDIGKD